MPHPMLLVLAALLGSGLLGSGPQERLTPGSLADRTREPFDGAAWSERLGAGDLEARERSLDALLERAANDPAAVEWLAETAAGGGPEELAWTARLALRLLERRGPGLPPAPRARLEELRAVEERLERMLGEARGPSEPLELRAFGLLPTPPDREGAPSGGRAGALRRGVTLQTGQGGVVLRLEDVADGDRRMREYRGESLEAVLEAHPELRSELGLGGAGAPRRFALRLAPGDTGVVRTDVLGVRLTPITDARAGAFGLEPGTGLLVEAVVPGTIARALGLSVGDVLVEIDGRRLDELDDVSAAISGRAEGRGLTVTWVDSRGRRRVRTWTPMTTSPAPEGSEAPTAREAPAPPRGPEPSEPSVPVDPPGR